MTTKGVNLDVNKPPRMFVEARNTHADRMVLGTCELEGRSYGPNSIGAEVSLDWCIAVVKNAGYQVAKLL